MGAETVATLIIVGVIVLALALFVFAIAMGLRRLSFTLGTIVVGLRAIREQTRPANPVLAGILDDVTGIESDLQGVLGAVGEALGSAAAPAPEVAAPEPAANPAKTAAPRAQPRRPEGKQIDVADLEPEAGGDFEDAEYEYEIEAPEEAIPVGAGVPAAGRSRRAR